MRCSEINRVTNETSISIYLEVDGKGKSSIDSGCPFLDHMLTLFACHGRFNLNIKCQGDTKVDYHHTVEDIGIVLGQAFNSAVGKKKGIKRYGDIILPMDESLVLCAIDLSGRPYFVWDAQFTADRIGDMSTEMVKEFFYAVSYTCGMNLHIKVLSGGNNHHVAEAMFKSFAKALDQAVSYDPRITDVLSTKGSLA